MKYPPRGSELYVPGSEIQRPIFGIDIDGTLGEYHSHFWKFACDWTGKDLPHPDNFSGGSFAGFLGMSKSRYREIKLAYRRGGAKRSMPVVVGASGLTKSLRDRGAIVVLCTTRPYLSMEGIDADTRHWAKRNKIVHDFIIWGENKYRDLARFSDRVVSVVDDEPAMLRQAMSQGLLVNKIQTGYNYPTGSRDVVNGYVCSSLSDVSIAMHEQLDEWEKRNLR